jgi:hypothetical protein
MLTGSAVPGSSQCEGCARYLSAAVSSRYIFSGVPNGLYITELEVIPNEASAPGALG